MGDNDVNRKRRWRYPPSGQSRPRKGRNGIVLLAVAAALIVAAFGGAYGTPGAAAATVTGAGQATVTQETVAQETAAQETVAQETAAPGGRAGPCDIYAAGGTPCVAAYSTTRALFRAYDGPLYQVTRASDGAATEIRVTSPGGFANAAAQNAF